MKNFARAVRLVLRRPLTILGVCICSLVVAFFARDASYQRDEFHLIGQLLVAFGQLDSFHGRIDGSRAGGDVRPRLGIESFELTRTACQPQHDDRFGTLASRRLFISTAECLSNGSQPT